MNRRMFIGKARAKAARRAAQWLLGADALGMPARSVHSLAEASTGSPFRQHILGLETVFPPQLVNYAFPDEFPASFRRSKAFDESHLYRLRDVIVSPYSGLAWLPEGMVLQESVGSLMRIMGWGNNVWELALRPAALSTPHPALVVPQGPYFHWVTETLPWLILGLRRHDAISLIHAPGLYRYVTGYMALLKGTHRGAITHHEATTALRCPDVIMPQVEEWSGFVRPEFIALLRQFAAALELPPGDPQPGPRRIYVSRSLAPVRPLANEAELEAAMPLRGFHVVRAETLTVKEQMRLFADAEEIVAPHGAGLTNMIWSHRLRRVTEIFQTEQVNDCYARLAVSLGVAYRYVMCQRDPLDRSRVGVDEVLKAAGVE